MLNSVPERQLAIAKDKAAFEHASQAMSNLDFCAASPGLRAHSFVGLDGHNYTAAVDWRQIAQPTCPACANVTAQCDKKEAAGPVCVPAVLPAAPDEVGKMLACVDEELFKDIGSLYTTSGVTIDTVMAAADANKNALLESDELEEAALAHVLKQFWQDDAAAKAFIEALVVHPAA